MEPKGSDSDDAWLLDDEPAPNGHIDVLPPWKVLVVDDEPDVHSTTAVAIRGVRYRNRGINLISAYSAAEAMNVISATDDIALILLDVVMETDDAGLRLAKKIRNELGISNTRIVLRTGQPGQAPEHLVILEYDINDYKAKTELTTQKLYTTLISSLRAYENIKALEKHRLGLTQILNGTANLYQLDSLQEFASGVLNQIVSILGATPDGVLCVEVLGDGDARQYVPLAATGTCAQLMDADVFAGRALVLDTISRAFSAGGQIHEHPANAICFKSGSNRQFAVYFEPSLPPDEVECDLLAVFCKRISAAYDALYLNRALARSQEATVVALAALAEFRDSDTGEHVLRVQKLTDAIAREAYKSGYCTNQVSPNFLRLVGLASILHDVGKVGIPDSILFKKGKLDPDEREIMKRHASIGEEILRKSAAMVEGDSFLSIGAEIAGGHHEFFDGTGYPRGRAGQDIPLSARIVAVVDVFDALLTKRPYKEPWPMDEVRKYIGDRVGSQFDPVLVEILFRLADESRLPVTYED